MERGVFQSGQAYRLTNQRRQRNVHTEQKGLVQLFGGTLVSGWCSWENPENQPENC